MPESLAQQIATRRRPRVQITYEVHTDGALEIVELPYVVGVLADLSGHRKDGVITNQDGKALSLKERQFVEVDRDNFNKVLKGAKPRLALRVDDKLSDGGGQLPVELDFKSMDDFSPDKVAAQVEPLKQLLDMRHNLTQLLSKLDGNDKLEQLLGDVLGNTEKALSLAKEMGLEPAKEGA